MREFSEKKKNGWWGDPVYLKFWGKLTLLEQKNANFQSIFARSTSAVTPSELSNEP